MTWRNDLSRRDFHSLMAAFAAYAGTSLAGVGAAVAEAAAGKGGELVLGMSYTPPSLNPVVQSGFGAGQPGTQLFASPLRYDEGWKPEPYLAKSWNLSGDGLTFTMQIVDNAKFHDGKPLTADDVAFSIEMAKAYHPFNTMFAPVEKVEANDATTVTVRLSSRHPALELAMSPIFLPVMPRHIYGDGQDLRTHPRNTMDVVGSGPFRFVEFVADQRIVLEKFDDFFMPDRPVLDRMIYRIVRDPSNMLLALQRGEVHYNSFTALTLRDVRRMKDSGTLVATDKGYAGIGAMNWIAFNTARDPWKDVRVRHAIAYGIDKGFVIDKMQLGLSRRALGPIADGSPFYADDLPRFDYDPAKAEALLDEAGFKRGADGNRLSLTIDWIPGTVEFGKNLAEAIKGQLSKIGVAATVRTFPDFASWNKQISATGDYDLSIESVFNWGDPVIGVHRTYLTSNIKPGVPFSNTSRYSNPRVDELLAAAAVETDAGKRKALYVEFQKIVVEDMPLHYIHTMPYYTIHDPRLAGLPEGIWGSMAPFDLSGWTK